MHIPLLTAIAAVALGADRFGVGVWPTTVATDGGGRVIGLTVGTETPEDPRDRAHPAPLDDDEKGAS